MAGNIKNVILQMAQGDDKRFRFNVVDANGGAIDISGSSEIKFVIADAVTGQILVTKTKSGGDVLIGINSQFYLEITSTDSGSISSGQLYFEVQITNSSGAKQTVAAGPFIIQDTIIGD